MGEIQYYSESDLPMINSWHDKRGIGHINKHTIPKTGFVVPHIAAGFIYMTDSEVSFIDGYVTNPDASSELRNEALSIISECLIAHAKIMGAKFIKCETRFESIEKRAIEFGFKSHGQVTLLIKEV